jgi:hypothetical protein
MFFVFELTSTHLSVQDTKYENALVIPRESVTTHAGDPSIDSQPQAACHVLQELVLDKGFVMQFRPGDR